METVGTRIKKIREMRGFSQKYVAANIGIHVTLLQQYERGVKKPKEVQLQKIAEALLVDVDMLRLPKADSGDAILAYVYELINCHGDVSIVEENGAFNIRIPTAVCDKSMQTHLRAAVDAFAKYSEDEFKMWLLNYRYHRVRTLDSGEVTSRYPMLEVTHEDNAKGDES